MHRFGRDPDTIQRRVGDWDGGKIVPIPMTANASQKISEASLNFSSRQGHCQRPSIRVGQLPFAAELVNAAVAHDEADIL